VDRVIDSLFALDIALTFNTCVVKDRELVYDRKLIAVDYMKGFLVLDVLSTVSYCHVYIHKCAPWFNALHPYLHVGSTRCHAQQCSRQSCQFKASTIDETIEVSPFIKSETTFYDHRR
jgi:hypothetical protein